MNSMPSNSLTTHTHSHVGRLPKPDLSEREKSRTSTTYTSARSLARQQESNTVYAQGNKQSCIFHIFPSPRASTAGSLSAVVSPGF